MSDKIREIAGKIVLDDGSTSEFVIGAEGGWQQWGATRSRLGQTVEAVEAIQRVLLEEELLAGEDEEALE